MSRIRKSVLDNGINVITEKMSDVESVSIGIWVKTGSRHETEDINGISHFIEHMLFKGTKRRNALEIAKEIESVGGVLNAFTGREYTCFYVKVLKEHLPRAIDLLSDMFMGSLFDPEEIEREKKVVLQEIKMVEDTPDDLVHDIFADTFWKDQPMGRPILGRKKTLKPLKREDIKRYIAKNYRPGSVFITAVGNVNHKLVVDGMAETLGTIKGRKKRREPCAPKTSTGIKLVKRDLEQVHLCMGVPSVTVTDANRFTIYLMNTILGSGMSSRLFQEVREKRGLAYSVYSYLNLCRDTGSFVVYSGSNVESFSEVVRVILGEFDRLSTELGAEELQHAKDQLKGGLVLGLETTDARMMKMAKDEIYFGKVIPIRDIVRAIDRVKVSELCSTAHSLLNPEKVTLTAIGKVKKSDLPKAIANKR